MTSKEQVLAVFKRAWFDPNTNLVWSDKTSVCNPLGRSWEEIARRLPAPTEPAPKDGEKDWCHYHRGPFQEQCPLGGDCERKEDWGKPAKVEAGDGAELPPLDRILYEEVSRLAPEDRGLTQSLLKKYVDLWQASLLREQKLKELLGEAANAIARHWDITDQAAKDVALKARAAAVKGE
jgi:hypothetical protein